jgi:16S rRNA processing protein RimM
MESSYRNIGRIVSAFGLKGEVILQHRLGRQADPGPIRAVFLEQRKGELLPFFPESVRKKSDEEWYMKLEGFDTREQASRLLKHEVWIREEELNALAPGNNPIGWVGYSLLDGEKDLGEILEVIEQPHQVLCRLEIRGKEVLVPVNEQTLNAIDHAGKKLQLSLPAGLLEVYLG